MERRHFIAASAAAALAAPRIARAADDRVLHFVPQAALSNLDPIWTTIYVVRNASLLFWDTLYGVDSTLTPHPQMCEGHETSADGLVWTFKLREGLKFHDNEPVRSRDVTASVGRWMRRDLMGQVIASRLDALEAVDDRTFRFRLRQPFPKLTYALAKISTPVCFIMPERIASTDPFKQITEYVGSGPMVFRKDQWDSGSLAVFERFKGYVPRTEKPDWLAGGKVMNFDRIEWRVIPDAATAAGALQSGEVDWWEAPIPDLIPLLKRNRDVRVDIADPLGNIGVLRVNHLVPPFDDVRVRRALMMATSQPDFMQAIVGDNHELWKTLAGYFPPNTPLFTEHGGDILKGARDIEGAKKLLKEANYNGEKIVILAATDVPPVKAQCDVTADTLRQLGMNVDYQAMDWGTMTARRAVMKPVSEGGWNIFHTWTAGADASSPATYPHIYCTGKSAWFGWPTNATVQSDIAAWYAAPNLDAEKQVAPQLNADLIQEAPFIPTGFYLGYQASRATLKGVVNAPFPMFWGVSKG